MNRYTLLQNANGICRLLDERFYNFDLLEIQDKWAVLCRRATITTVIEIMTDLSDRKLIPKYDFVRHQDDGYAVFEYHNMFTGKMEIRYSLNCDTMLYESLKPTLITHAFTEEEAQGIIKKLQK